MFFATSEFGMRLLKLKKPRRSWIDGVAMNAWQCPTLTRGGPALSSALSSFTSEFGMGSGGAYSLLPPGNWLERGLIFFSPRGVAAFALLSHVLKYAPSHLSSRALRAKKNPAP